MDFVAEVGDAPLQPMDDSVFLSLIECGSTTFLIDLTTLQQRVDNHEYLMRQRHNRFLLAAPRRQPTVKRGQEGLALLDRRPRRLDQGAAQILVPIADARRNSLNANDKMGRPRPSGW